MVAWNEEAENFLQARPHSRRQTEIYLSWSSIPQLSEVVGTLNKSSAIIQNTRMTIVLTTFVVIDGFVLKDCEAGFHTPILLAISRHDGERR